MASYPPNGGKKDAVRALAMRQKSHRPRNMPVGNWRSAAMPTMISQEFISTTEHTSRSNSVSISRGRSATASVERAAHLVAVADEPRSDDNGRRFPPNRPLNPGFGWAGALHQSSTGKQSRVTRLHLSHGDAMTVDGPPSCHAASVGGPPAQDSLFPGRLGAGGFFIQQEQWR
jgi:hypothetical protein